MLKALFMKFFGEAIKPFDKRLKDVEDKTDTSYDRSLEQIHVARAKGEPAEQVRKPLIAKSVALSNLAQYIKDYEAFKGTTTRTDFGSEVEFYERNNKTLKTETLRGTAGIDAFIARARKDEVRLVRQVR